MASKNLASKGALAMTFLVILLSALVSTAAGAKDLYKILGVSRTASDKDIKKAFYKLSLKYHPDKNPSKSAKTKYLEISNAYDVLSDPEKRKTYDLVGDENPHTPPPPHGEPHFTSSSSRFGQGSRQGGQSSWGSWQGTTGSSNFGSSGGPGAGWQRVHVKADKSGGGGFAHGSHNGQFGGFQQFSSPSSSPGDNPFASFFSGGAASFPGSAEDLAGLLASLGMQQGGQSHMKKGKAEKAQGHGSSRMGGFQMGPGSFHMGPGQFSMGQKGPFSGMGGMGPEFGMNHGGFAAGRGSSSRSRPSGASSSSRSSTSRPSSSSRFSGAQGSQHQSKQGHNGKRGGSTAGSTKTTSSKSKAYGKSSGRAYT
eukprot:TRINITY_DN14680_c0_g1_i2.p1 TRINITY_DN14680_c0_g1~~TRINITY_DN14680_c0_g1_i2.p1  ORF type:complete len:367 (-),score=2.52 TRINITY_DN14680_c0_g1_i2:110-1210(-)